MQQPRHTHLNTNSSLKLPIFSNEKLELLVDEVCYFSLGCEAIMNREYFIR